MGEFGYPSLSLHVLMSILVCLLSFHSRIGDTAQAAGLRFSYEGRENCNLLMLELEKVTVANKAWFDI
jgi:hypothetical protein